MHNVDGGALSMVHGRAGGRRKWDRAAAALAAWLMGGGITLANAQDIRPPAAPAPSAEAVAPPVATAVSAVPGLPDRPKKKSLRRTKPPAVPTDSATGEAAPLQPQTGALRARTRSAVPDLSAAVASPREPAAEPPPRESEQAVAQVPAPPVEPGPPPPTIEQWSNTLMLERLCAQQLLHNEEDRLFGMISLAVRATIRYDGGFLSGDLIDEAAQDSLDALLAACPQLAATDRPHRLGVAIAVIRDATVKRMEENEPRRNLRLLAKATAADLSEELTSREIDAWLDGLTPPERALALFLYASDVTAQEIAEAVGVARPAMVKGVAASKSKLLWFFRQREDGTPAPFTSAPAIEYRQAGEPLAALLRTASGTPQTATMRITGISRELVAGWSLLATVTGLPPDRNLDVEQPFILAAEGGHQRRLIVTASAEIGRPEEPTRRFLLKAYAIDGDAGGVGFHETLRFAAPGVDNQEALRTLGNPFLSNIEIARCLWHDYGKSVDPGLCR
jgi:DNA-directed RNA polymerase specialized sigma24 family protein